MWVRTSQPGPLPESSELREENGERRQKKPRETVVEVLGAATGAGGTGQEWEEGDPSGQETRACHQHTWPGMECAFMATEKGVRFAPNVRGALVGRYMHLSWRHQCPWHPIDPSRWWTTCMQSRRRERGGCWPWHRESGPETLARRGASCRAQPSLVTERKRRVYEHSALLPVAPPEPSHL